MMDAFRQQIADDCVRYGFRGPLHTWFYVFAEVPACISLSESPWQFAGLAALSISVSILMFWGLIEGTGVASLGVM